MKDLVVLLVARGAEAREAIASALEAEGALVMACPGPGEPDYMCIQSRGGHCPLSEGADVVVIDLELAGDVAMAGTPGWELMLAYVALGKKVVAIVGPDDPVRPTADGQVAVVRRPGDAVDILEAIRAVLGGVAYDDRTSVGK